MKKCIAIGEALIDFIPSNTGLTKDVVSFEPKVGGAPANVLGAFAKLGGESILLTKLGEDGFAQKIIEELKQNKIDTSYIKQTNQANTSLAFVALQENGNREFTFYRKPGADMLLEKSEIDEEVFKQCFALHFCSVDLVECPTKYAHIQAITYAKQSGALISFDPNLRFALWDDLQVLKDTVWQFIPYANILKISDEELEFLCDTSDIQEAIPKLMIGDVKLVLYTKGSQGAQVFTKYTQAQTEGIRVKAVDTTGAGDGFMGSFLFQLCNDQIEDLDKLSKQQLENYLTFSNQFCAYSVQRKGAIDSYPTIVEI